MRLAARRPIAKAGLAMALCLWACFAGTACLVIFPHVPAPPPPNKDTPEAVARDYWEISMAESPIWATSLGDRRFDAVMPDLTVNTREANRRSKEELYQRLMAINAGALVGEPLTTARMLAHILDVDLTAYVCNNHLWSVDPFLGIPALLMGIAELQPMNDSSAAPAYLTRLEAVGTVLDQHMGNLRDGLSRGYHAPRAMVERTIRQVEVMITQDRLESPFLLVLSRAQGWPAKDAHTFREDIAIVLRNTVYPALRSYLDFLMNEYLPKARNDIALTRNPDGDSCYSALMRKYTGQEADPQELHDLAQRELDTARARMTALAVHEGAATLEAYALALRAKPTSYAPSREALLDAYRGWINKARTASTRAFMLQDDPPLELKAVSAMREQAVVVDLYEPAPLDAPGRAVLFVNTRSPRTRPLFFMEAHAFAHTYPGRHLQWSAMQTNNERPTLRRAWTDAPMREGWSAYAQVLADELGLYSGPPGRFGMLHAQAEHAARMAVDTGVHILGWTREDAIKFMRDNLLLSDDDIGDQVDRTIAHPARALASVVGRRFFESLRAEAERKQGAHFDLKAFHAHLLSDGVPHAAIISDKVRIWLAQGI